MTIEFMHYRRHDKMGQIEARGGLTLAIKKEGAALTVAFARCDSKDNFSRELGRTIAQGRLLSTRAKGLLSYTLPEGVNMRSYLDARPEIRDLRETLQAPAK